MGAIRRRNLNQQRECVNCGRVGTHGFVQAVATYLYVCKNVAACEARCDRLLDS